MANIPETLQAPTSPDEAYHPLVAVAAVDILGVKNLVSRSDSGASAIAITRKFVRNACWSGYYARSSLDSKVGDFYRTATHFGDSAYLFADPRTSVSQQVSLLASKVASLIAIGLWGDVRFLVRAAIATGDLRTTVVDTDSGRHEIRVGTAMVRAHLLENAQCWIGGALAADSAVHLDDNGSKWTVSYAVPLKNPDSQAGHPLALNWIGTGLEEEAIVRVLRMTVDDIGADAQATQKLANTEKFVRAVYTAQSFAPFEVPAEQTGR